jgi:penicillin-binding protein 2
MIAQPQPGLDLVTTLDLDLQIAVEQSLGAVAGDERGAVVVLDPRTGDLLAMASAPRFDAAEFIEGVPTQRWKDFYLAEPARPTMNRATLGQYAPGSTFKIIDAMALLEAGLDPRAVLSVQPNPENPAKGRYLLGKRSIGDTAPPGAYDFRRAFIRSSNSYFIDHSLRLGWERLLSWGARFGLGQKTGIGIAEERGDFPTLDAVEERGWNSGNLANVSIGQQITLTPLQLAVAVGAVANGGTVFWPRLVDRLEPQNTLSSTPIVRFPARQVRTQIQARPESFDVIRSAMRDDVLDPEGTGKAARIEGFDVCGKTGTAEIKGNGRKDKVTWFASFAPFEAPRYVVIVMVESGASGGGTCAPVARRIYEHLHRREQRPERQLALRGGTP